MQEFFLRVDEEEAWIREREPAAASTDYGKDHSAVVALQQKHEALEAEIEGGCVVCMYSVWYETNGKPGMLFFINEF